MLVWQSAGSGKTLTGLTLFRNLPGMSPVVVLPAVGVDFWKAEARRAGYQKLADRVRILTYDKSPRTTVAAFLRSTRGDDLEKCVIVFDEAHHLISVLRHVTSSVSEKMLMKLTRVGKMLLITSTPMVSEDTDFRLLVNVAAGKPVLPVTAGAYRASFYRVSKFHIAFFSWYFSVLNSLYQTRAGTVHELSQAYEILNAGENSGNSLNLHQLALADRTGVLAQAIPLLNEISRWATNTLKHYKLHKLFKLDKTKLAKAIQPYVSYSDAIATNLVDAPNLVDIIHTTEYSPWQVDLWVRFLFGRLDRHEQTILGASPNQRPLNGDLFTRDLYRTSGRAIGNLEAARAVPPKFVEVVRVIADKQAVVYSSFRDLGTEPFSNYLKLSNLTFGRLTPKLRFKEKLHILGLFAAKKIQVLVLDPDYYQSVPVVGAQQMHILEPLLDLATLDHVKSRVLSPYTKSVHGYKTVEIHRWVCTTFTLLSVAAKMAREETGIDEVRHPNVQDMTPDAFVHLREALDIDSSDEIKQAVQQASKAAARGRQDVLCRLIGDPEDALPLCSQLYS